MSAYPFDASGEEDDGEAVPGESPSGNPPRNRLELHLHHGMVDIDVCFNGSRHHPSRASGPVAGDGEHRDSRLTEHGHEWFRRPRQPRSKSRPETFRAASETLASASTFRRGSGPSVSFWEALRPAEREQFKSRAKLRTFAAGARLMREGETADQVVVILRGQTEVRVDDHGTERVLARRGPGQLIGERAALQVNVRSATVIALNIVRALVMQTEDFAAFLSAHPGVLEIVESQVYFRLTEEPPNSAGDDGFLMQTSTDGYDDPAVPFRRARTSLFAGENCTVVYTDVVGFSSIERDDYDRLIIRHDLAVMTRNALRAIWDGCFCDDRGDGALIVVPSTVPTAKVLEYLLVALPIALRRHNEDCTVGTQFQLRVALDVGAVVSDEMGVSGEVIINTKRLLDSLALKRAIRESDVPLALIVSDAVYQYTVKHAKAVTNPAAFKRIRVKAKGASLPAWMSLVSSPVQVPPRRTFLLAG